MEDVQWTLLPRSVFVQLYGIPVSKIPLEFADTPIYKAITVVDREVQELHSETDRALILEKIKSKEDDVLVVVTRTVDGICGKFDLFSV